MNSDDAPDAIIESFESPNQAAVPGEAIDGDPVGKIRLMGQRLVGARSYALMGLAVTAIALVPHQISHPTTSFA